MIFMRSSLIVGIYVHYAWHPTTCQHETLSHAEQLKYKLEQIFDGNHMTIIFVHHGFEKYVFIYIYESPIQLTTRQ